MLYAHLCHFIFMCVVICFRMEVNFAAPKKSETSEKKEKKLMSIGI